MPGREDPGCPVGVFHLPEPEPYPDLSITESLRFSVGYLSLKGYQEKMK